MAMNINPCYPVSQDGVPQLLNLPGELLLSIVKGLSTKGLASFSLTCKTAYRVASPILYSPPSYDHHSELRHIIQWAGLHGCENTLLFAMHKILDLAESAPWIGYEALLSASRAGFTRLVDMLLQAGVKPNAPEGHMPWHIDNIDRDFDTPLTFALMNDEISIARFLLARGADLNRYDYRQLCRLRGPGGALHNVSLENLFQHGLNINIEDAEKKDNLLHHACQGHSLEDVKFLVKNGFDIHKPNAKLETPLCLAIHASRPGRSDARDIIWFLLQQGAPVNGPCNKHGWTPLHVAAARVKPEAVKELLKFKADVNALRHDGLTALASLRNRTSVNTHLDEEYQVADALLHAKASLTINKKETQDLLQMVIERGHPKYVQCLLNAWQIQAPTALPLHLVLCATAATGDLALTKEVLKRAKPLTEKTIQKGEIQYSVTPLMAAVKTGNEALIELIANETTNFDALNSCDQTALHLALEKGSEKTIRLLLPKTTNIQHPDLSGNTPLVTATTNQLAAVLAVILSHFDKLVKDREAKAKEQCPQSQSKGKFWPDYTMRTNLVQALEVAASLNKVDNARVLLNYLEKRGIECDRSHALHTAIAKGLDENALMMVQQNLGLESLSSGGFSPLMIAASRGSVGVVEALVAKKVDLYVKGPRGETATSLAATHQDPKLVRCILTAIAADITALENEAEALDCKKKLVRAAVRYGCAEVLEKVLSEVAPGNKEQFLNDLLLTAAAHDNAEVVKVLLWCGADANPKEKQWRTPIAVAIGQCAAQTIDVLLAKGADLFKTDYCGRTPLHYAEADEMVKLIYSKREVTGST